MRHFITNLNLKRFTGIIGGLLMDAKGKPETAILKRK